jgi:acetyl-CoA carboxylase carboxyl transferase subunit alpha
MNFLDFEQPIAELEAKIEELRHVGRGVDLNISEEIAKLEAKSKSLTKSIFGALTSWQIIQLARHPLRPHAVDYIKSIFTDFDELHGDRAFADDKAIMAGLARLNGMPVMVIGQEKGRNTREKIERNFGMPHPEGYRKVLRLLKLAEKFNVPVITLIDTPGAYPGVGAEARGQSEAIARNLLEMAQLKVPIVCLIIGEGCSGGALGMGVGDVTLIMQYAYYATISPEGCASILWKGADKAPEAAEVMGVTPPKLLKLKLVDEIVAEPLGGAHRDQVQAANSVKEALTRHLTQLKKLKLEDLLAQRYEKLLSHGIHAE